MVGFYRCVSHFTLISLGMTAVMLRLVCMVKGDEQALDGLSGSFVYCLSALDSVVFGNLDELYVVVDG